METEKTFVLKPYSLKELADAYRVCTRTLKKWLAPYEKEIGQRVGNIYTIPQVLIIVKYLGIPGAGLEQLQMVVEG